MKQKTFATTLATIGLLSGCATTGQGGGQPSDSGASFLSNIGIDDTRQNRYCAQVGALGAAVGGATGFGIAKAADLDKNETILATIAGAVVGTAIGCQFGFQTADRRQAFETESARLQTRLAEVRGASNGIASFNNELSRDIALRQQDLANLSQARANRQDISTGKAALVNKLRQTRTGVDQSLQQLDSDLAFYRGELQNLERAAYTANVNAGAAQTLATGASVEAQTFAANAQGGGGAGAPSQAEIAQLRQDIAALQRERDRLAQNSTLYASETARAERL